MANYQDLACQSCKLVRVSLQHPVLPDGVDIVDIGDYKIQNSQFDICLSVCVCERPTIIFIGITFQLHWQAEFSYKSDISPTYSIFYFFIFYIYRVIFNQWPNDSAFYQKQIFTFIRSIWRQNVPIYRTFWFSIISINTEYFLNWVFMWLEFQ